MRLQLIIFSLVSFQAIDLFAQSSCTAVFAPKAVENYMSSPVLAGHFSGTSFSSGFYKFEKTFEIHGGFFRNDYTKVIAPRFSELKKLFEGTPIERQLQRKWIQRSKNAVFGLGRTQSQHWIISRGDNPISYRSDQQSAPTGPIAFEPVKRKETDPAHWVLTAPPLSTLKADVAKEFDSVSLGTGQRERSLSMGDLIREGSLRIRNQAGEIEEISITGKGLQVAREMSSGVQFYFMQVSVGGRQETLILPPSLGLTEMSTLFFSMFSWTERIYSQNWGSSTLKAKDYLSWAYDPARSLRDNISSSPFRIDDIALRGMISTETSGPNGSFRDWGRGIPRDKTRIWIELGTGEVITHDFHSLPLGREDFYSNSYLPRSILIQKARSSLHSSYAMVSDRLPLAETLAEARAIRESGEFDWHLLQSEVLNPLGAKVASFSREMQVLSVTAEGYQATLRADAGGRLQVNAQDLHRVKTEIESLVMFARKSAEELGSIREEYRLWIATLQNRIERIQSDRLAPPQEARLQIEDMSKLMVEFERSSVVLENLIQNTGLLQAENALMVRSLESLEPRGRR